MFSKRNQTLGSDWTKLENSKKWVSLDSEIRKYVNHAILHFKWFHVKHWTNNDVKWNVFETQPNSWKWLNIIRK